MELFRSKDNTKQLKNIETKKLTKVFQVKNHQVQVDYLDARYGELNGEQMLLDEEMIQHATEEMIEVFTKHATKYHPVPTHITISNKYSNKEQDTSEKPSDHVKDFSLSASEPRYALEEVYIPSTSMKQIQNVLSLEKHSDKLRNEWGLSSVIKDGRASVLNFFGPPGTGKSMAAEAIASYLGKKVMNVNYAQLESKYVGETPKNIRKCFAEASKENAVLIFDEADSFLGKRLTNVTQSADYGVNVTRSVMLMELERFSGVVIFTTNLIKNYDDAFKRRILASIQFNLPDQEGRSRIWNTHIPEALPLDETVTPARLAEKFNQVSGADIKDMVLYAAVHCLERDGDKILFSDFQEAYHSIQSRYADGSQVSVHTEVISEEQFQNEMKQQIL